MHLKTLGSGEHNDTGWQVEFHEDFLPEFLRFSEAVRRQAYVSIELLKAAHSLRDDEALGDVPMRPATD